MPSLSSEITRVACSSLVFCCLTVTVQQIHSLRASGVKLCQAARAAGEAISAFFKSAGILWTVPPASCSLAIRLFYRVFLFPSSQLLYMVQYVSRAWNTLLPSLLQLAEKLELVYVNGKVYLMQDWNRDV